MPETASPLRTVVMPEPAEDPNNWFEDSDYGLQQHLGLLPSRYPIYPEAGEHPDERPCPWWCHLDTSTGLHDVDPEHPFKARHSFDGTAEVPLCLYAGEILADGVLTAAAGVEMASHGDGGAIIRISKRTYVRGSSGRRELRYQPDLFKLSATEARGLARALTFFADVAEADGPTQ